MDQSVTGSSFVTEQRRIYKSPEHGEKSGVETNSWLLVLYILTSKFGVKIVKMESENDDGKHSVPKPEESCRYFKVNQKNRAS